LVSNISLFNFFIANLIYVLNIDKAQQIRLTRTQDPWNSK